MDTMKVAEAIADRVYTGHAHVGVALYDKIKRVAINILATHEAEDRRIERDLHVERMANKGTCAQFRITINSLKVSRARAQREAADNAVTYHDLRLAISMWENRTGLDHNKVLAGVYGNPLGDEGHCDIEAGNHGRK